MTPRPPVNRPDANRLLSIWGPVGRFRQGLLVTHDEPETWAGMTEAEVDRDPTNFSYVSWGEVAKALKLKTHGKAGTRAGNDPRFR